MVSWNPTAKSIPVKVEDQHIKIKSSSLETLRMAFRNADFNLPNYFGRLPIHSAFLFKRYDVVRMFLEEFKADPFAVDCEKKNCLHYCAEHNTPGILDCILNRSDPEKLAAAIEAQDEEGCTPLYIACDDGSLEVAKALLVGVQRGFYIIKANVNARSGKHLLSALHAASIKDHHEIVELLLSHQAATFAESSEGYTPAFLACQFSSARALKSLLDNSEVNINLRLGPHKWTLLHSAASKGFLFAIPELIKRGADPNGVTGDGFTPLFLACTHHHFTTARKLIEAGSDVNQGNGVQNSTALHICKKNYPRRFIRLLIEKGGDPNKRTISGLTPLCAEIFEGNTELVDTILKGAIYKGQRVCADVNLKFNDKTPLQISKEQSQEAIEYLIKMNS